MTKLKQVNLVSNMQKALLAKFQTTLQRLAGSGPESLSTELEVRAVVDELALNLI